MKDKYISTNIKLTRTHWALAKMESVQQNKHLWEIITEAIELYMKQQKPKIYGKEFFEEISGEKQP